ncbi:MAG TPA: amylo-alpha-1,6-glucosidase [Bryobacteraceae bacterium]|nr:amylo-alpha-1,6-glucosidase [Bryobacteraceae bacterium]
MNLPTIRIPWPGRGASEQEPRLSPEWLLTNGLGGYASGTLLGIITRRYHGYLVAALPAPFGRVMMFNDLVEHVELPNGKRYQLGGEERAGVPIKLDSSELLSEFRLEGGLPVWCYELDGSRIEKRLVLPHGQNTVYVNYRLLSGAEKAHLLLRPSLHFRPHEDAVSTELDTGYVLMVHEDRYEVALGDKLPSLRFLLYGSKAQLTVDKMRIQEIVYRIEERRGYPAQGDLWSAGYFHAELRPDAEATLVASTESWETMSALAPADAVEEEQERRRRLVQKANGNGHSKAAANGEIAQLLLAADQFLITPAGRIADGARARAVGDEIRTMIAGYHWFTDWGRDTMISLEGITLSTGRTTEAAWILRTFAHYIRDGLIPNLFPEGKNEGLYHTADATLWFFHAIDRYTEVTGERSVLQMVLPKLVDIFEHHMRGTRFGIRVDPEDGLLTQGAEGYALTWMDAKVDDWVVTPRRGKAVEINALWYNALRLLENWLSNDAQSAIRSRVSEAAKKAQDSFNRRFWSAGSGLLLDVVDGPAGDDPACRPNQLLALSLKYPVLDPAHWKSVVEIAESQLLTPVGLRSLSPEHKDYKPKYDGDLRSRDAAYHQGTVWAWLIGPFIDAWLKVHPEDPGGAKKFLEGFTAHSNDACVGSISEIFDAEEPFTPRGCIAQAWSVAEVLRCRLKLAH